MATWGFDENDMNFNMQVVLNGSAGLGGGVDCFEVVVPSPLPFIKMTTHLMTNDARSYNGTEGAIIKRADGSILAKGSSVEPGATYHLYVDTSKLDAEGYQLKVKIQRD